MVISGPSALQWLTGSPDVARNSGPEAPMYEFPAAPADGRPLRVGWLGPVGDHGVPGAGRLLVQGLLDLGVRVDLYHLGEPAGLPPALRADPRLSVTAVPTRWRWGRWYSRGRMSALASGLAARGVGSRRLARLLRHRDQQSAYDVIFQFSQPENLGLGRTRAPWVVHPCSHAAGELRWHRHESRYAREAEGWARHFAARGILRARSVRQRRDLAGADLIIGPSRVFVDQVVADYGLDTVTTGVLRHPVDLQRFAPDPVERAPGRKLRLLYVARLSARKGLDLIVDLSHRLDDLDGEATIEVVGGHTLWSDYRAHLRELNPRVARYVGTLPAGQMPGHLRGADALLVPSTYEPGSLAFGEALASGLPVVASDAVGPTEVTGHPSCRTFASGDPEAFERAVRSLLPEVRNDWAALREGCRREAVRLFDPSVVGKDLLDQLLGAVDGRRPGRPVELRQA